MAECRTLEDEVVVAELVAASLTQAGGHRYRKYRRPELYRDVLGADNYGGMTVPAWKTTVADD